VAVDNTEYLPAPPATFSYYRDRKKEWRWRIVAKNGRKIAVSSEAYKRKRDAARGAELALQALYMTLSMRET
jgi:uncharacterized protein YegP (UPF0339 family)